MKLHLTIFQVYLYAVNSFPDTDCYYRTIIQKISEQNILTHTCVICKNTYHM